MKKIIFLLMALTILSKIFGFMRELTLTYFYGADVVSDAFFISLTIPQTIFRFVGVAIVAGFIPIYTKIYSNEQTKSADKFASNVLNLSFILSTFIVVVTMIFTRQVLFVFASGFTGYAQEVAVSFTRITVFAVYCTSFVYVFRGYLQINNNYWIPAILPIPMNIIIVLGIALSSDNAPEIMAFGFLVSMICQVIIIIPFLLKYRFSYHPRINLNNQHVKTFLIIIIPILISVAVRDVNKIVSQNLASNMLEGSISALNYARRLDGFIQSIVFMAITTAMFPLISKMASKQDYDGLKRTVKECVNISLIVVIPATVGAMLFSSGIVQLLFQRGAFGREETIMTASALFFLAIGMLPQGLKQVFQRSFFAINDTKTPVINSSIAMLFNIILSLLFYFYTDMGISGLALATSIASTITVLLLLYNFHKKIGSLDYKNIIVVMSKVLIASLVMGIVSRLFFEYARIYTTINENLLLLGSLSIGAIVYFIVMFFMGVEDFNQLLKALVDRFTFTNRFDEEDNDMNIDDTD